MTEIPKSLVLHQVAKPAAKSFLSWGMALILFMRCLAILWLAKGLLHWSIVLGIDEGATTIFMDAPLQTQTITIILAVTDLVAAVGLWLLAPWGGVIWLVTALFHGLVTWLAPHVFGHQPSLVVAVGGLVIVYLFLAFMASRQGES